MSHRGIPARTVERLTLYRRVLRRLGNEGQTHVFSHQLATLSNTSSAQVRRDLMSVSFSGGTPKHGYPAAGLIARIDAVLDAGEEQKLALVGIGNLGRALLSYFSFKQSKFKLVAAFDKDRDKVGRVISGCRCYPFESLVEVVREEGIKLGVVSVPAAAAQEVAEQMVEAGIIGILNFAPTPLRLPKPVFAEQIDITMTLEKIAYFALK